MAMSVKYGLVGLPNVGKSTLFNRLTQSSSAISANYPFCTVKPNIGSIVLIDPRLDLIARTEQSLNTIHIRADVVDIPGLIRDASLGKGMGNEFLRHIQDTDHLIHVVRCFDDDEVIHVDGSVDPLRDIRVIEEEIHLRDLDIIERRLYRHKHSHDDIHYWTGQMDMLKMHTRTTDPSLISSKGITMVAHGNESTSSIDHQRAVHQYCNARSLPCISVLPSYSHTQLLTDFYTHAFRPIRASYFTTGASESRAWAIDIGCIAPVAASKIHMDFYTHFVKGYITSYSDWQAAGSIANAKRIGKVRLEGKKYVMQDGDIATWMIGSSRPHNKNNKKI